MKIMQINIRVNMGSVSRITEQIGLKVLKQGWESYIAYGRPSNPSKSELIPIGSYNEVKLHYLMSHLTGRHGLFSNRATKRLVEKIKEIQPDIIHLQNIHGYYINYKVLFEYLNSTDIPVVWTLHDCWSFTGHCSHFVTVNCEKWKTGCNNCPLIKKYPRSLFFDYSKENYELKKRLFTANVNLHIIAVSQWLANITKESFLGKKDIRVITNGIDLSVFTPGEVDKCPINVLVDKKFVILAAATAWTEDKGILYYKMLSSRLKKDELIVLVGIGRDAQKNFPANIICLDKTKSQQELVLLYRRADLVMSLSKAETFGLTIVEAMACGTPSIVYDNTAQPELIDEQCGLIVPTGDIDALLKAIEEVRIKGKGYYSDACVERANKYFNKEERYNDYIELYRELCD